MCCGRACPEQPMCLVLPYSQQERSPPMYGLFRGQPKAGGDGILRGLTSAGAHDATHLSAKLRLPLLRPRRSGAPTITILAT
mmetsp:Transcript_30511/g.93298  ORF Transcript_30511/g.93298 Transcript_30511/m.93298 type:complete len:82 (+) Transcript_30511:314-559(+)